MEKNVLSVSDFIAITNQTLEYAYPSVCVVGEVESFKINQEKYIFFNLKDETASVGCFMMAFQLRVALEDGMRVKIIASPKVTNKGKFSLTVREIVPVGEGSIKRNFELLVQKLKQEGLFDESRKRSLPQYPRRIGIISSQDSAGYADFVKILNERWGGLVGELAHVRVQGDGAADQIIRALTYFNERTEPVDAVVIIRGGGSADELSVFNDEKLVRHVAGSRAPTLAGIGHEVDTTLIDFVADVRASTPSNAAQLLVPDKRQVIQHINHKLERGVHVVFETVAENRHAIAMQKQQLDKNIDNRLDKIQQHVLVLSNTAEELNPLKALARGYAIVRKNDRIVRGETLQAGDTVRIETSRAIINAGITHVTKK